MAQRDRNHRDRKGDDEERPGERRGREEKTRQETAGFPGWDEHRRGRDRPDHEHGAEDVGKRVRAEERERRVERDQAASDQAAAPSDQRGGELRDEHDEDRHEDCLNECDAPHRASAHT